LNNNWLNAKHCYYVCSAILVTWIPLTPAEAQKRVAMEDFLSLSIEELSQIRISSVSKQEESLADAPASIYVITRDDIDGSGATTIPEALRLAPNLNVARRGSNEYAISARGFNNAVGNKLLVLIDGRTVYTPLFSGVFWSQPDIMLEDVDRIEVISGPGATLWGANAVNGVINIITRSARDTQGVLVSSYGGNFERGVNARYGGTIGDNANYRAYVKAMEIDETPRISGLDVPDNVNKVQAGFRIDWESGNDRFTFQGDSYSGKSDDRGIIQGTSLGRVEVSGANLLARWNRRYNDGSDLQVQGYWDRSERDDIVLFHPDADIYDIEFQYSKPFDTHRILVGGGYRRGHDHVGPGLFSVFIPDSRSLNWSNLFIQDEFQLTQNLEATLGIKLESNDYTGVENLPNLRLAWKLSERDLVWTSLSRAVRAPSRYDRDVFFPGEPPFLIFGGPNFESEVAEVFEMGYRTQVSDVLSYSVTGFYHEWDKLRGGTAPPVQLVNKIEGRAYGGEAWASWQVTDYWRLSAGTTVLRKDLRLKPGSTGTLGSDLANDPEYQRMLRSTLELPGPSRLDVHVRYVSELPNPVIPAYTAVDVFYGLQLGEQFEISLSLQNMFDTGHIEFDRPNAAREHERKAFLKLTWTN
jgi:iron complex outermembrane receptor protein